MRCRSMLRSTINSIATFSKWRQEVAERQGYRVNYKRVAMAYGIELLVIAASLYGAYYFAITYGHGDENKIRVMMLAPVGYAIIEFCRVPLALSARTQTNWGIKVAAIVGVILAALVTVKSMSQLGYLMFQPRLEDVTNARHVLADAQQKLDDLGV